MKFFRISLPILSCLAPALCNAHFVWAQYIGGQTKSVSVCFAEAPGNSELDLIGKVAPRIKVLSGGESKYASPKATAITYPWRGTGGIFTATLEYGVTDHGQGPSLLTYWIKAVSRPIQASKITGKGLEIVAIQHHDRWDLSVYFNGKPCPEAEIVLGSDDTEEKHSASKPVAVHLPDNPIDIPVRASFAVKTPGTYQGKAYQTHKIWATLVLPAVGKAPAGADESAYLALQNSSQGRETITLRGFQCEFTATNGGANETGTVTVSKEGKVTVALKNPDNGAAKHISGQIQSLISHRLGNPYWKGEGRYPITWSPDKKSILVNDAMKSRYELTSTGFRIVERTFGPKLLTLTMLTSTTTPFGGILSKTYEATEVQVADKKLLAKYRYTDDFTEFGDEWMPKQRTVNGTVDGRPITMKVTFDKYSLLP